MADIERRLAAIVLADVAGYSALMERNETRTYAKLRSLREEIVFPAVERFGGRIVKTTGDGFLATFASGTGALQCCIEIQRLNRARESSHPKDERLALRIGINVGDIIADGDDVSGDGVNVAARLEGLAGENGICVSGPLREQIRDDLGVSFLDLGQQRVKNLARPIRAYRVTVEGGGAPRKITLARVRNWRTPALAITVLLLAGGFLLYAARLVQAPDAANSSVRTRGAQSAQGFAGIRITHALVIGNGKYLNQEPLDNTANDAVALATALRLRGVPVSVKLDVGEVELRNAIEDFRRQDGAEGIRFLFYAGHGWNVNGRNFIYPVDAPDQMELRGGKGLERTFPVDEIYHGIAGRMIALMDTHGEPTAVPENVVLTFSGSTSHLAHDSYRMPDGTRSQHSPYAASIIEMLAANDENLPTAFLRLTQRVEDKTKGKQIPWISASIVGAISWGNRAPNR